MSTELKQSEEVDATGAFEVKATAELEELEKQHEGLIANISTLKKDVQTWQQTIEAEAKEHSQALDGIRSQLRGEVANLRSEFDKIRQSIQEQMEESAREAKEDAGVEEY